MPNESQEILEVFQRIFRRKKWFIAICVIVVLVPISIYNFVAPPVYEASTMLVFEEFNNPVAGYDFDFSRDVFFSNQLVEIKSNSFALDIVKSLPPEIYQKFDVPDSGESSKNGLEYVVDRIQRFIAAYPVRGSNIIQISFQSNKPEISQAVANAAADVLQKRNFEFKREGVGGVRKFIESQLARYKIQLDNAETSLKDFKEKNNITSVDKEAEEVMRRLTDAEVLYNTVKTDKGSAQKRLDALQQKLAQQKSDLVPSITDIGSSWAQKLRERLVELNLQYMNLKVQGYPEDHPKMVDLRDNMERIRTDLTEKASKLAQSNESSLDPLAQMEKYVNESVSLQIELESLKARERALEKIMQEYNEQLKTLPDKEFELARYTRERDVNHKIYTTLLEKLEEAKISEAEQTSTVRVIDKAKLPVIPVSPRKRLNLVIGFLLGLIMGVVFAFISELRNKSITSSGEVETLTQWPVVAMIPNMNTFSKGKFRKKIYASGDQGDIQERSYRALYSSLAPNTPIAEAYRMLRTNLQFSGLGRQYKTLLVTSLGPGDGKTTTITNLAISFASFGNRTLIVDSDLRIPVMHNFFGLDRESGITDLLEAFAEMDTVLALPRGREPESGNAPQQPVQQRQNVNTNAHNESSQSRGTARSSGQSEMNSSQSNGISGTPENQRIPDMREVFEKAIKETGIANLSFVSSGRKMPHPEGLISIRPLPLILQKFTHRFNTILIDSAPLLLVNDTLMLAGTVDAVLLVVDANKCDKEMLLKAKKLLENSKANVVGIVLNNFEMEGSYKTYYSSYYSDKV